MFAFRRQHSQGTSAFFPPVGQLVQPVQLIPLVVVVPMVVVAGHDGQVVRQPKPVFAAEVVVHVARRAVIVGVLVAEVRGSASGGIVQPVMLVPALLVVLVLYVGMEVQVVVAQSGLDGRVQAEGGVGPFAPVVLFPAGAVDGDAAQEVAGGGMGEAVQQALAEVGLRVGVERAGEIGVAVIPLSPTERGLQAQEGFRPVELEIVGGVDPGLAEGLSVGVLLVGVAVRQEVHARRAGAHVGVEVLVGGVAIELVFPVAPVHHVVNAEEFVRPQAAGELCRCPCPVGARQLAFVHVVEVAEGGDPRVGREAQAEEAGAVAFFRAVAGFGVAQPAHAVFPFQPHVHYQFLVAGLPSHELAEPAVFVIHLHVLHRI